MRKTKTIKIDDKEITVKELRAKDVRKILSIGETLGEDILKDIERLLPLAFDIKPDEFEELAPSEIQLLWDAFKEVNAIFLAVIGRLGITQTFGNLIQKHLSDTLAGLSNTAIPAAGNTDGASL
jgi:hypothetical protein